MVWTSCGLLEVEEEGFKDCDRGFSSFILRLLGAAAALPLFRTLRRGSGSIVWRSAWSGVRTILRWSGCVEGDGFTPDSTPQPQLPSVRASRSGMPEAPLPKHTPLPSPHSHALQLLQHRLGPLVALGVRLQHLLEQRLGSGMRRCKRTLQNVQIHRPVLVLNRRRRQPKVNQVDSARQRLLLMLLLLLRQRRQRQSGGRQAARGKGPTARCAA